MPRYRAELKRAELAEPDAEHERRLQLLCAIAEILQDFVPEGTEIVVHDLRNMEHSIVGIVNGHVTQRVIGDAILRGPAGDKALAELSHRDQSTSGPTVRTVRGYTSYTKAGAELRSSSVIIHDAEGQPAAGFCINGDLTAARILHRFAQSLLFSELPEREHHPATRKHEQGTINELIEEIITDALSSSVPIKRLSKEEKMAAVAEMNARGIFLIKGSAERVGKALGITRFTVYNYLDELAKR